MERMLEGLKVLDFTWAIAGPFTSKFLSDHGAMVVKIENPGRVDMMRTFQPFKDGKFGLNRSGVWNAMNAGKYSMGLEMTKPKGVEIAKRLADWCDVLVENFAPGTMKKWGMGYDDLKKTKPDLIMVSMSSMGQTGPFAHYHGLGYHLQGFAGFNQVTGFPDREPFGSIAYTDFTGPPFAVCAIMGALDFRRRTGQGMFIDLSQVEAAIHLLGPAVLDMSVNGREAQRYGNFNPRAAPHAAYRCKGNDRWCVIAVFTDEQWRALAHAMGSPAWTRDPRFQTSQERLANLKELDAHMERWTMGRPPEEVRDVLQAAGVPASVVETGRDLAEDKHLAAREFFQTFPHPEIESAVTRRAPVRYSDADSSVPRAPATLGQDNELVCTKVLGMSDEEWVKLLEEGVLLSA